MKKIYVVCELVEEPHRLVIFYLPMIASYFVMQVWMQTGEYNSSYITMQRLLVNCLILKKLSWLLVEMCQVKYILQSGGYGVSTIFNSMKITLPFIIGKSRKKSFTDIRHKVWQQLQ